MPKNLVLPLVMSMALVASIACAERYQGFPHHTVKDGLVEVDGIVSNFVSQQPLMDESQGYVETLPYGQTVVTNPKKLDVNCPGLVRLKGKLLSTSVHDKYGGFTPEWHYIQLEDFQCLDYLKPANWYQLKIDNGKANVAITNPFPKEMSMQVDIAVAGNCFSDGHNRKSVNLKLSPGEERILVEPLNCLTCLGEEIDSSTFIIVSILFKGDYRLFDVSSTSVSFTEAECPAPPELAEVRERLGAYLATLLPMPSSDITVASFINHYRRGMSEEEIKKLMYNFVRRTLLAPVPTAEEKAAFLRNHSTLKDDIKSAYQQAHQKSLPENYVEVWMSWALNYSLRNHHFDNDILKRKMKKTMIPDPNDVMDVNVDPELN